RRDGGPITRVVRNVRSGLDLSLRPSPRREDPLPQSSLPFSLSTASPFLFGTRVLFVHRWRVLHSKELPGHNRQREEVPNVRGLACDGELAESASRSPDIQPRARRERGREIASVPPDLPKEWPDVRGPAPPQPNPPQRRRRIVPFHSSGTAAPFLPTRFGAN